MKKNIKKKSNTLHASTGSVVGNDRKVAKRKQSTKVAVGFSPGLKSKPRTRCATCGSYKSYMNPTSRCCECKEHYCFDHIWSITAKDGVIKVCDKCKQEFGYVSN